MLSLKAAARHESAHAVVDYLIGINISYLCVAEDSGGSGIGVCQPDSEHKHLKVQCVALLAGMFGAQLVEEEAQLRIPSDDIEFATYGAYGWDYQLARQKCRGMIANRTENWITQAVLKQNPGLKPQYDVQQEQGKAVAEKLLHRMMEFTLSLVSYHRRHILGLADLLLTQEIKELAWPDHGIEDYQLTTLPVRRLEGVAVNAYLEQQGLIFGNALQLVEAIPYPEGYNHCYPKQR